MALRLRHRATGEVYGWNPNMAKMEELEEFDDEDPQANVPQTAKTPPVQGRPPQTVVGDNPQTVMDEALARAAAAGEAEVTTDVTPPEEATEDPGEDYFLADDDGNAILDTNGSTIATDADGNQLDPAQVPVYPGDATTEVETETKSSKRKK